MAILTLNASIRAEIRFGQGRFGGRMLMIDPICGMTVEPNSAAGKFAYEGLTII
jgi:hypothetical protein